MFSNLAKLVRYRGLIQTLVVRDLKARYRGSVLGFFWSFFNPLLLLLIYSFVFTQVLVGAHDPTMEPYALFMFCGILPWTWFSSSVLESSNTLIAGGNLIKKVLFPAEVLPDAVSVLAQVAERAEDLDQARAEAGMKRAEMMMQPLPHEIDFERARLAMLRTLQQLQAESRRGV